MRGCCPEVNDIGGGAGLIDGIIETMGGLGGGGASSPLLVGAEYWTVFGGTRGRFSARPGGGGRGRTDGTPGLGGGGAAGPGRVLASLLAASFRSSPFRF